MRLVICFALLGAVLLGGGFGSGAGLDSEKAAILKIHELDRAAHLQGNADYFASRVAPVVLSVADGKTRRMTREG